MRIRKNLQRLARSWQINGWRGLTAKLLTRSLGSNYWNSYTQEANAFASWFDFSTQDIAISQEIHHQYTGSLDIRSATWFLPDFHHVYYGGIYTLLRFANYLQTQHGIQNRFAILGSSAVHQIAQKIGDAFPALAVQPVQGFYLGDQITDLEPTDIGIASLWGTAYSLLRFNQTRRKFYFIQDYEPLFYPAGSIFAQVEATYRFGFYGLANTPTIRDIYQRQYGGKAISFNPCVDTDVFYPALQPLPSEPYRVFFYGRPAHSRNGFELGAQALRLLKKRLGERVQILAAGEHWKPASVALDGVVENLGRLDYRQTADLYRTCHVGLVMMFTRHPSYLPLELMASGCAVVTNDNPATAWLLKNHQNSYLTIPSATCIADTLEEALINPPKRHRIVANALQLIQSSYANWLSEFENIYAYMCNPT